MEEKELQIPLWAIIPTLIIFSSIFFMAPHMNYTMNDWVIGNSLIAGGIGSVYLIGFIFKIKPIW